MTTQSLALLIDADNASPKIISGLLAEVANYGTASVKRVYGDWTKPNLNGWKECLLEHSLQPVQQLAYTTGKGATDGAMIIDAMDLLYTGRFSGFWIVSSDSDFARLAARIREQRIPWQSLSGGIILPRRASKSCGQSHPFDLCSRALLSSFSPNFDLPCSQAFQTCGSFAPAAFLRCSPWRAIRTFSLKKIHLLHHLSLNC